MYKYIYHFALQQKLIQHCKLPIIQFFKKFSETFRAKSTIYEMKHSLDEFNSRLETTEKKGASKLGDQLIENTLETNQNKSHSNMQDHIKE